MKWVVFLVHGIGRHINEKWADNEIAVLIEKAESLQSDAGANFTQKKLLKLLTQQTVFRQLNYDDDYRTFAKKMLEKKSLFKKHLKQVGLSSLSSLFTTNADKKSALRDNLFDILIYWGMREHRNRTRRSLLGEIYRTIQKEGKSIYKVSYSVLAHSMGTMVAHDALQVMSEDRKSKLGLGWPFWFQNVFMVANTSAFLQTEYDPLTSNVRPYLSVAQGRAGYTRFYWDFAHKFDPVAQLPFSFKDYMRNQPQDGFVFTPVKHFRKPNIHALSHYFEDPAVYMNIFRALYGDRIVPPAYVAKILAKHKSDKPTLAGSLAKELGKMIEKNRLPNIPQGPLAKPSVRKLIKLIAPYVKELL